MSRWRRTEAIHTASMETFRKLAESYDGEKAFLYSNAVHIDFRWASN